MEWVLRLDITCSATAMISAYETLGTGVLALAPY